MVPTNETGELTAAATAENMAALLMPPPPPPDAASGLPGGVADRLVGDLTSLASKYTGLVSQPELPPNCPAWATQLKSCEVRDAAGEGSVHLIPSTEIKMVVNIF